jgi:hypothetical protein
MELPEHLDQQVNDWFRLEEENMPIHSLEDENLDLPTEGKTIVPSEPAVGEEVSTFVQFDSDVTGEITTTDKKIPRLNLGQKSGALGDNHGQGNLILNKELVIAKFGQTILATCIKIKKQYQERRKYDPSSTTMPKMFDTAKDARTAGFATEWGNDPNEKLALPIAHILWFIPAPEGLDADTIEQHFNYDFEGRRYAAAIFTTSPTGYNVTAKPIFTAMDTPKVKELGIRCVNWRLVAEKQQNAINSWYNLKNSARGYNSPEFIKYTKEVLK